MTLNATITDAAGNLPQSFSDHAAQEALFIFDKDTPGVSIDPTWNTLGMRATGSHTLVLEEAHVGPEAFGGNFRLGLVGEAEWAAILFGGVYLGLADKAYTEALEILKRKHVEVDRQNLEPFLDGLGPHQSLTCEPSVVHKHVHRLHAGKRLGDARGICDIAVDIANPFRWLLGVDDIEHHDLVTQIEEGGCDGGADSPGAAGHKNLTTHLVTSSVRARGE